MAYYGRCTTFRWDCRYAYLRVPLFPVAFLPATACVVSTNLLPNCSGYRLTRVTRSRIGRPTHTLPGSDYSALRVLPRTSQTICGPVNSTTAMC